MDWEKCISISCYMQRFTSAEASAIHPVLGQGAGLVVVGYKFATINARSAALGRCALPPVCLSIFIHTYIPA
jgi:hypothetical protein